MADDNRALGTGKSHTARGIEDNNSSQRTAIEASGESWGKCRRPVRESINTHKRKAGKQVKRGGARRQRAAARGIVQGAFIKLE